MLECSCLGHTVPQTLLKKQPNLWVEWWWRCFTDIPAHTPHNTSQHMAHPIRPNAHECCISRVTKHQPKIKVHASTLKFLLCETCYRFTKLLALPLYWVFRNQMVLIIMKMFCLQKVELATLKRHCQEPQYQARGWRPTVNKTLPYLPRLLTTCCYPFEALWFKAALALSFPLTT